MSAAYGPRTVSSVMLPELRELDDGSPYGVTTRPLLDMVGMMGMATS